MKKVKVLFFLNSSLIGGAERNFLDLAIYLKNDLNITIAALEPGGPLLDLAKAQGIKVFDPGFSHYFDPFFFIKIIKFLLVEKFEILFISGFKLKLVILPVAFLFRVPIRIAMILGLLERDSKLFHFSNRVLNFCTTYWVANSLAAKKWAIEYEKVDPERVSVIYNGTFFNKESYKNRDHSSYFKIAVLANIKEGKGHTFFLDVVREIKDVIPNLKIEFIGKDESCGEIQKKIVDYGLKNIVLLPGFIENVPSYIRQFHLMVLPSFTESFPNSIVECMFEKVPVVATRVGGIPEMIEHNKSGLLFEAGNKEQLHNALTALYYDSEYRERLAQNAFEFAIKNFTISKFADSYLQLIKFLLDKK